MKNVLFKEQQRYTDKTILAILGVIVIGMLIGAISHLIQAEVNYLMALSFFSISALFGVLIWWLTRLKLKVVITNKFIRFKLSPIHVKKHTISWKEIDKCEIVKTSEAAQWSGGNITFNHEKRISLTGRNGLALRTQKGEHYFIGCKNIEGLKEALEKIDLAKE